MVKRKIIWTHKAQIKLFEILDFYSKRNKGKSYSQKLYRKFTEELELLANHPEIGKKSEIEEVRGLIVDGFILFYEFTSDKIFVHTVWNCRQNPDDLKIK